MDRESIPRLEKSLMDAVPRLDMDTDLPLSRCPPRLRLRLMSLSPDPRARPKVMSMLARARLLGEPEGV